MHEQAVFLAACDTWLVVADAVVPAQNKHHLVILNATGSPVVLRLRKLFCVNVQTVAVTGAALRFELKRITARTAGTVLAPVAMDTTNAALPAQVTCVTAPTAVTEGPLLFPLMTTNEENTASQALTTAHFQQGLNILPESPEMQELALRSGEGVTVKQITAATAGAFAWIAAFTSEVVA